MSYVPLRLQSNWSLLKGASPVSCCLDRAAHMGLPALALTDDNLFGAVPFFEQAGRFGIKPILGATLSCEGHDAALRGGRDVVLHDSTGAASHECHDVVLLVENEKGYANLCRILSARALEERFSLEEALAQYSGGLFLLTPVARLAERLRDAFGDRVYVEITSSPSSYKGELPKVACMKALFAESSDFPVHRLLTAFRLGKSLAGTGPEDTASPEDCLRTPQEMARRFRDNPLALENTHRIAERCSFDLLKRETTFPRVAGGDGPARLCAHAQAGVRRRFAQITPVVAARLERELEAIISQGFADYFLVVEEIVRYARALGTPTAGRGSGAGSLVAYVLGITNVDPVQYDLPFERFLNEGRTDYPDLDVDFCWRLRDDVIDYTYNRFGRDRVAMIATYATFGPRMALRESAKVLGLSNPVITQIANKLRRGLGRDRFDTLPADPGVVEQALVLARSIEGYPHHLSVHCGGVVITPGPIAEHAPLLRAEKGVVITAYDKDGVERVGLVKIDLLGNRSLS
ncbi:MAG: PHP domain-containing protein, partial [Planctomycetota bacterium]